MRHLIMKVCVGVCYSRVGLYGGERGGDKPRKVGVKSLYKKKKKTKNSLTKSWVVCWSVGVCVGVGWGLTPG